MAMLNNHMVHLVIQIIDFDSRIFHEINHPAIGSPHFDWETKKILITIRVYYKPHYLTIYVNHIINHYYITIINHY